MKAKLLILCSAITLAATANFASAKQESWFGKRDSHFAHVGWAVVKLEPNRDTSGYYVPTDFTFQYHLDAARFPGVESLQLAIFDNVDFVSPHVSKIAAEAQSQKGQTDLELKLNVTAPHVYHIAYGPRVGEFQPSQKQGAPGTYKLDVTGPAGAVTWVSYWIGDATIARLDSNQNRSSVDFVAPDVIFDPTMLDLLRVPALARTELKEETVW